MFRIMAFLLILLNLGFGQGKSPTLPPLTAMVSEAEFKAVNAKVDSLSKAIEKAQVTTEAVIRENQNLREIFREFSLGLAGLFLVAVGGLGIFIWRRTEAEREFVAGQVKEKVKLHFETQFTSIEQTATSGRAKAIKAEEDLSEFKSEMNVKWKTIDNLHLDTKLKLLSDNHEMGQKMWRSKLAHQLLSFADFYLEKGKPLDTDFAIELIRDYYSLTKNFRDDMILNGINVQAYNLLVKVLTKARELGKSAKIHVGEIQRDLSQEKMEEIGALLIKHNTPNGGPIRVR